MTHVFDLQRPDFDLDVGGLEDYAKLKREREQKERSAA
jgi:hypothetical protein